MRQLLFLLLLFPAAYSHARQYTGKVTDESGIAVADVTVQVKGSATGVITNSSGEFRIKIASLPATLVFSAVGFKTYETKITAKTGLSFQVVLLRSHEESIDEVVVTGYGMGASAPADYHSFPRESYSSAKIKTKVRGITSGASSSRSFEGSSGRRDSRKVHYAGDSIKPATGETFSAGLLTAGEISDFKKWKMWEDFNEDEFKTHSQYWNISAVNRYTVQVQNKAHKALVGVKVQLIDAFTNLAVWTTVSDNTGKAELWTALNGKPAKAYKIAVEGRRDMLPATTFANGINMIEVDKQCGAGNKVQISFVVDATGSMGDEIGYLKQELEDIITRTFEKHESLDLSMSSVFYRDKTDDYVTRKADFETDILKVINFIKMQQAGGGGDYPEAVNDALRTSIDELSWDETARARILFIVLDAPPHEEAKVEMLSLMKKAAAKGIRVVPVACSGTDKSTEFLMRSMALATNGSYIFLTDHSGIGGSHIEPTTDSYSVELLNDLLQRTIEQMVYVNECTATTAQVKEPVDPKFVSALKLKVYPNPTTGKLIVETDKEIKEMYVSDFSGKILMRIDGGKSKTRFDIDLTPYPSATYFIRYITAEGKQGAERVILVR